MRCPVPYALVALFGWGLIDWIVSSARRLLSGPAFARRSSRTGDAEPTRVC